MACRAIGYRLSIVIRLLCALQLALRLLLSRATQDYLPGNAASWHMSHNSAHTHTHTRQIHTPATHTHRQATACKITAIFYCGSAWLPDTESIPQWFQAIGLSGGEGCRCAVGKERQKPGRGGTRQGSGTLPGLGMLVTLRFVGFCYH